LAHQSSFTSSTSLQEDHNAGLLRHASQQDMNGNDADGMDTPLESQVICGFRADSKLVEMVLSRLLLAFYFIVDFFLTALVCVDEETRVVAIGNGGLADVNVTDITNF